MTGGVRAVRTDGCLNYEEAGDTKYTMHAFQTPRMGQAWAQTAMSGLEGDTKGLT